MTSILPPPGPTGDWSDYILGVALMLESSGRSLSGADLIVWSDVPIGAGLSSWPHSNLVRARAAHRKRPAVDPIEIAQLCQRAENDFVGMRCGVIDQYISCCGIDGYALDRLPQSRLASRRDRAKLEAAHRQQQGPPPACGRRV